MEDADTDPFDDNMPENHDAQCPKCFGTGLITTNWSLSQGLAFICPKCKGEGKVKITFMPFVGKQNFKGVQKVRIQGHGSSEVTYEEFVSGKMPIISS